MQALTWFPRWIELYSCLVNDHINFLEEHPLKLSGSNWWTILMLNHRETKPTCSREVEAKVVKAFLIIFLRADTIHSAPPQQDPAAWLSATWPFPGSTLPMNHAQPDLGWSMTSMSMTRLKIKEQSSNRHTSHFDFFFIIVLHHHCAANNKKLCTYHHCKIGKPLL